MSWDDNEPAHCGRPCLLSKKQRGQSRGASSQRDWLGSAADALSGLFHLFLLLPFHPIATPRNTQRVGGVPQRIRFAKSIKVTAAFARTPLVWGLPLPSTAHGGAGSLPRRQKRRDPGRLILREGWKGCEDYRGRITLAVDAAQISRLRWALFGRAPGERVAKVGIIWWVCTLNPVDMSCGLFSNNIHETR